MTNDMAAISTNPNKKGVYTEEFFSAISENLAKCMGMAE